MKRFLSLLLIYTLNILIFLFAKSAGATELNTYQYEKGRSPAVVTRVTVIKILGLRLMTVKR